MDKYKNTEICKYCLHCGVWSNTHKEHCCHGIKFDHILNVPLCECQRANDMLLRQEAAGRTSTAGENV